jgi:hypothetical protein
MCTREIVEDRIIDYAIAFEALFYRENDGYEIAKKLSNRVARLLTDNESDREEVRREMRVFYDARNKIVKGDEEREDCLKQLNIDRVEENLRNANKIYINRMATDAKQMKLLVNWTRYHNVLENALIRSMIISRRDFASHRHLIDTSHMKVFRHCMKPIYFRLRHLTYKD